ncbi:hypothetical protein BO70DRAFT_218166 [Aspergillus heteromorphus CBS 117.55]|uniref:Uncharacterized protein n=1 Tax=Aspergillus heteromorphus CBS 117.55 TaxID=1448321 RepID=A0A317WLR5_9EURO|nr:uncharacterized protein BO70DRAFT_218166 [Aspergillus heteromorphus CBS 117.55]PWY85958.1 hypothetical protein BO70DRAFT_218166 [Aspergillus heteromorphus CBS 117.55]
MSHPGSHCDVEDWPIALSGRASTISSSTSSSSAIGYSTSPTLPPALSRTASSIGSQSRQASCFSLYDDVCRLPLNDSVTIAFVRSGKLFKLRYTYIDIRKDASGSLKCFELGGGVGQQTPLIHTFNGTKLPVPHLEHPKLPNEPSLRISFMDEQTVQSAQTVFTTQISYTFDEWKDCVQFQELILRSKLVFIAGIAEAKSKGRGEECMSQNLRVLRGHNGKEVLLFFANSQRKDLKRYVHIPVNCIDSFKPGKKAGKPVVLQLQPNFDLLTQMRTLNILFLDDLDRQAFCEFLAERIK